MSLFKSIKKAAKKVNKKIKQYQADEPKRRQERINKLLDEEKRLKEIKKEQDIRKRVDKLKKKTFPKSSMPSFDFDLDLGFNKPTTRKKGRKKNKGGLIDQI